MTENQRRLLVSTYECPDCGGPRRDNGGKVLEYRHTEQCPRVEESRRFWSVLTGGRDA